MKRLALYHATHCNESLLNRCQTVCIDKEIQYRRLRWLGHVGRMHDDRLPKRLLFSKSLVTGLLANMRGLTVLEEPALWHNLGNQCICEAHRLAVDASMADVHMVKTKVS